MPHVPVKLVPGVNADATPSLNEAAIASANLIRFRDGLVEKLGGWTRFFPGQFGSPIREIHAWLDLNGVAYLGVGAEQTLGIISNGLLKDVTPQTRTTNPTPSFDTTSGSATVTVDDPDSNVNAYDTIFIATPVSVGGIVLFGSYPVETPSGADSYTILAADKATSTVTNGGTVPAFNTTIDQFTVQVTLADHGYSVGDTFPILVSTTVGGLTLLGLYTVTAVSSSSVFTIATSQQAAATATASMNGGKAQITYYIAVGPPPPGSGYGILGYGMGAYGTGTPLPPNTGTPITAPDWSLDNWGQILLACPAGGPIYQWSPDNGFRTAQIIPNAPTANGGMFVAMPQQILVTWGASVLGVSDPLLVRWSDVANFNVWTAQAINQAGSYRIPRGSKIVGALQGSQQGLLWTDLAVWAMQYIRPPLVFGFNQISDGCGLIGRHAAVNLGAATYWMSQKQFFVLSGGVRSIPCPIWDVVFQNIDFANAGKIRAAANSQFNEVAWYYPSLDGGGEVDSYVKYNVALNVWDYGTLSRTAWIDQSVLGAPIGATPTGWIYQHETSPDADGAPLVPVVDTGYFAIQEGLDLPFVDWVIPDFKFGYFDGSQTAEIQITFRVADYPSDAPRTYGPYTVSEATEYINTRFRGRLVAIRISSSDTGSFWRIGNIRFRVAPDGRR